MQPLPQSIAILGGGASGLAVVDHLVRHRTEGHPAHIALYDSAYPEKLSQVAEDLRRASVALYAGADALVEPVDLCIASPGIPPASALFRSALARSARVISEIEFAFERSTSTWVGVTGTNGKTTVTSLITHLLREGGLTAEAVGNIGDPAISVVDRVGSETILVAEVSSFQLASTENFRPKVAVLLNITEDHFDWHGSFEAYARDKAKLFANLADDDVAIIDIDDPGSAVYADAVEDTGVRVIRVSRRGVPEGGVGLTPDSMLTIALQSETSALLPSGDLSIKGAHNVSNALAAAAAASVLGVDLEAIQSGLRSFAPVSHRLQSVITLDGVEYINDSKATNPASVVVAVQSFPDSRVVLLLGGRNKGSQFHTLASTLSAVGASVIAFGEAAEEIAQQMRLADVPCTVVADLADAVDVAARIAIAGDVVLLSPGCASFDQFDGFAHRGEVFVELVRQIGAPS